MADAITRLTGVAEAQEIQAKEDAMKTPIVVKEKVDVDLTEEVTGFVAKAGVVAGAVIGVWALTCLVAALINVGPLGMVRGYITAVTGY